MEHENNNICKILIVMAIIDIFINMLLKYLFDFYMPFVTFYSTAIFCQIVEFYLASEYGSIANMHDATANIHDDDYDDVINQSKN
jgi:hypothetical protein